MRHPAIRVKPAAEDGLMRRRRHAVLHSHGASKAEEAREIYYPSSTFTIEALEYGVDAAPTLKIREDRHPGCPEGCNTVHHARDLVLDVPELMALRALADVTLTAEDEDMSPRGMVDESCEEWIREQLASGNSWAWFSAKVTATWCGFEGVAYLGGCSYRSEADFRRCSFDQVADEALADLKAQIERAGAGDSARRVK